MSDANMDEIAATQGGIRPQRIADMRRAFDDPAVDLVSSVTQNHWHGLSSLWAVQAGKHVYVEKPGNHNVHEGWALEAASKKYNRIVQIGTQMRSMSANIELMRFLHAGGIG
jgi:predicted dehydrogenase